jgi:hypothetical protein
MTSIHRAAAREIDLAHNEGFVRGAGAMLGLMRRHGPTGWWRFYAAKAALDLPNGERAPIRELLAEIDPEAAAFIAGDAAQLEFAE